MRGRMFGLVQSLMRIDLLLVTATTPFVAGVIGTREGPARHQRQRRLGRAARRRPARGAGRRACPTGRWTTGRGVPLRTDLARRLQRRAERPPYAGTFVALEGGEGAGKSTQLPLLEAWLRRARATTSSSPASPAARPTGGRIRELLLDPCVAAQPAGRGAALRRRPRAARRRGRAARRWSAARSCSPTATSTARWPTRAPVATSSATRSQRLSTWATGGLRPDLVVLLDVDPAVGLAPRGRRPRPHRGRVAGVPRAGARRASSTSPGGDPDRYLVVAGRPARRAGARGGAGAAPRPGPRAGGCPHVITPHDAARCARTAAGTRERLRRAGRPGGRRRAAPVGGRRRRRGRSSVTRRRAAA